MSNEQWEKAVDRVSDDIESKVLDNRQASADFLIWVSEERPGALAVLIEEWLETKDGKDWEYAFVEEEYEQLNGGGRDDERS